MASQQRLVIVSVDLRVMYVLSRARLLCPRSLKSFSMWRPGISSSGISHSNRFSVFSLICIRGLFILCAVCKCCQRKRCSGLETRTHLHTLQHEQLDILHTHTYSHSHIDTQRNFVLYDQVGNHVFYIAVCLEMTLKRLEGTDGHIKEKHL
jgi:hypothetical protein